MDGRADSAGDECPTGTDCEAHRADSRPHRLLDGVGGAGRTGDLPARSVRPRSRARARAGRSTSQLELVFRWLLCGECPCDRVAQAGRFWSHVTWKERDDLAIPIDDVLCEIPLRQVA